MSANNGARSEGLSFDFEWVPADGVAARELAATWADFAIYAGDDCITQVEDRITGSSRRRVFVSLYPVAEWMTFNWWFLHSHARPSLTPEIEWRFSREPRMWEPPRAPWLDSHSLRGVAEGFRWPDLAIVPDGELMRLRWFPDSTYGENDRIRYISAGETWAIQAATMQTLRHFIETVIVRLEEEGVTNTPLQAEWHEIQSLDPEEQDYFSAAARLGLDAAAPDVNESSLRAILGAAQQLDEELLDDLFDAVGIPDLPESARWAESALRLYEESADPQASELPRLEAAPPLVTPPWAAGYQDAQSVRNALSLSPDQRFPVYDFMRPRLLDADQYHLQGLTGRSKPLVLHRRDTATGIRFTSARALWHHALGERDLALVTDAHTSRQQRVRAFAAELLAPAEGIRDALDTAGDVVVSGAAVERVAHAFDVSPWVVGYQIQNQLGRQVAHVG